jgi:hypothetical protein
MPTDSPIACSLTTTEIPARLLEISTLARDASLLSVATTPRHATLRFRVEGDIRKRLAAFVTSESECCAFLDIALREEPESVELVIAAPPGAEPVLESILAAFGGRTQAA